MNMPHCNVFANKAQNQNGRIPNFGSVMILYDLIQDLGFEVVA